MEIDILNDDNEFIKYQMKHYFNKYMDVTNKFSYVDAVNDYIFYVNIKNKTNNNFFWLEVINSNRTIDIYFLENSNIENIMSNKKSLIEHYNTDIIKNQTHLIISSVKQFPFFIIRSGWDIAYININQPCLLRTSRRENNDFGVLIPDSSTQGFKKLYDFKKNNETINFKEKMDMLVWRGAYSGLASKNNSEVMEFIDKENKKCNFKYYSRWNFVNKFCDKYDVKMLLTNRKDMIINNREETVTKNMATDILLDQKNMAKNYKFQIALNGNSFAGSFGWNLLSTSIVFHPDYQDDFYTYVYPRKNIDYVPIKDDYEDLDDKINYFIKDKNTATIIAENGKKYMDKLLNLTEILTKMTMDKIYLLYDQKTFKTAVNLMDKKLTKVSVKLKKGKFALI
jgi:hypothetical protein